MSTNFIERDQERQEGTLAQTVEHFSRRWRPSDVREGREFEMELNYLVISLMRIAQQPLIRHMADAMALVPIALFFPEVKSNDK